MIVISFNKMMSNYNRGFFKVFIIVVLFSITSCKSLTVPTFSSQVSPAVPNYNEPSSWAVLPNKYSDKLSDWKTTKDSLVADVFYVYPTLNIEKKDVRWNVPIEDILQQEKVLEKAVYFQASAFLNAGKLYVPFYRQAHLRSYSEYDNGGDKALNIAYADIKNAFIAYLEKYNNGRSIIIAAHSQGTTHAIQLLKDFFDGKPLHSKLIAAYIPGIAIKKNEFINIPLMTSPTETGGFVSWNTFKMNHYPKRYSSWYKGSVVSNPISWNTAKTSSRKDHKGFLFSNGKLYKQALKVKVADGILWTSLPHFPYRIFILGKKRYHEGDINLFWEDIRENALVRVHSYLKKNEMITQNSN
ncbi:DUF3089 domain-containing protein [Lutibacter sp.]|uniref:DUF3089 domain-containing protein n=1 Tax=Lutibacter sp. TaxID=1925666 RepID=UPI0025BFF289|nr:DUF3089 domain-containing protein [Lutibacter sp.]